MKIKILTLVFCSLLFFLSCQKNNDLTSNKINPLSLPYSLDFVTVDSHLQVSVENGKLHLIWQLEGTIRKVG
ncbi:hypothetical protein GCM10017764_00330 [Sphingobacterium griseoflavum]|uniref:Glycosyl-hydrolase 97 N-terminal domain-containing protein n=1 Tax=Sphingobacterium griseoflavum TaxID=1474952 RepID=A0ABQ3HPA5_9SPHI|nr:hypothetical protein GCM10017764_00330 [Sphingobacterium griseoflavum]